MWKSNPGAGRPAKARAATVLASGLFFLLLCGGAWGREGAPAIRFAGNTALSEEQLRQAAAEELADFERRGFLPADIDDASWQMENAYRRKGFAFARIRYFIAGNDNGGSVRFVVEEGPRVILGRITITGNETVPEKEILPLLGHSPKGGEVPFVRVDMKKAAGRIGDFYYQRGHVKSVVDAPRIEFSADRLRADVTFRITEGPRHVVRGVAFEGDILEEVSGGLDRLAAELEGEIYQARQKILLRSRAARLYRRAGYPDVVIKIAESMGDREGDVLLAAAVTSGPRVRISDVQVTGHRKTRPTFMREQIRIAAGDWYDAGRVNLSIEGLSRTGLFRKVESSLEGEAGSTERILRLDVEEAPSRGVTLELGWGSYEQARGRIGLQEKNLLGRGLLAGADVGGSLKSRHIGGRLVDTSFLGTGITASFPVAYNYREEPAFTTKSLEGSLVLMHRPAKNLNVSLKYGFKNTETVNIDAREPDPNFRKNYNLGSLVLRITRDTRDDFFYPTKGSETSLSLESADQLLGGDLSFLRFTFASSVFHSFGPATVLALRLETGLLYPTEPDTPLPLAERFFNGGENSIRSFKEDLVGPKDLDGDPLGGIGFNIISLELRRRLGGHLAASLFVDAGNVMPNFSRAELGLPPFRDADETFDAAVDDYFSDFRTALGAGLQYLLPVGPARIDVAANPAPREGEDKWALHFTLGMAF